SGASSSLLLRSPAFFLCGQPLPELIVPASRTMARLGTGRATRTTAPDWPVTSRVMGFGQGARYDNSRHKLRSRPHEYRCVFPPGGATDSHLAPASQAQPARPRLRGQHLHTAPELS